MRRETTMKSIGTVVAGLLVAAMFQTANAAKQARIAGLAQLDFQYAVAPPNGSGPARKVKGQLYGVITAVTVVGTDPDSRKVTRRLSETHSSIFYGMESAQQGSGIFVTRLDFAGGGTTLSCAAGSYSRIVKVVAIAFDGCKLTNAERTSKLFSAQIIGAVVSTATHETGLWSMVVNGPIAG